MMVAAPMRYWVYENWRARGHKAVAIGRHVASATMGPA
jgi:hypothetical protein